MAQYQKSSVRCIFDIMLPWRDFVHFAHVSTNWACNLCGALILWSGKPAPAEMLDGVGYGLSGQEMIRDSLKWPSWGSLYDPHSPFVHVLLLFKPRQCMSCFSLSLDTKGWGVQVYTFWSGFVVKTTNLKCVHPNSEMHLHLWLLVAIERNVSCAHRHRSVATLWGIISGVVFSITSSQARPPLPKHSPAHRKSQHQHGLADTFHGVQYYRTCLNGISGYGIDGGLSTALKSRINKNVWVRVHGHVSFRS